MEILQKSLAVILSVGALVLWCSGALYSEEKQWSGAGDGASWADSSNWYPASAPTISDEVNIDTQGAKVIAAQTFFARTLKVGGRNGSDFTAQDFVYGAIAPLKETDEALYIRKQGLVTLKGPGDITLKGSFKSSEESLPDEPGFMFGAE